MTVLDEPPFERPDDEPDSGLGRGAWEHGVEEVVTGRVLVDAAVAKWALQHVGPDHVVEERPDGAVVMELPVTNRAAFRSFVLGFLDHAEVLDPPELRAEIVDWLTELAR